MKVDINRQLVKRHIEINNLSIKEVATKCDLTCKTVKRILDGGFPSWESVGKIAKGLELNYYSVLTFITDSGKILSFPTK